VTDTYQEKELMPFESLIKKGVVDIVMTAHIMNRKIDPDYPATLSSIFLKDILRGELKFDGVIMSDDMQMKAIADNFGFEESIVRAINSGCDILIFSNNGDVYDDKIGEKAINIIYESVMNGEIKRERIIESSKRISLLKRELY
jgi:beta-N-acetylhexosaminidase